MYIIEPMCLQPPQFCSPVCLFRRVFLYGSCYGFVFSHIVAGQPSAPGSGIKCYSCYSFDVEVSCYLWFLVFAVYLVHASNMLS